jgi:hypothetical protein
MLCNRGMFEIEILMNIEKKNEYIFFLKKLYKICMLNNQHICINVILKKNEKLNYIRKKSDDSEITKFAEKLLQIFMIFYTSNL